VEEEAPAAEEEEAEEEEAPVAEPIKVHTHSQPQKPLGWGKYLSALL
jgi:hypothetical protein